MSSVAAFIGNHREEILQAWVRDAARVASAHGLTAPVFSGIMPEYLSSLAEAGEELGRFTGSRRKYVESHFAGRLREGFLIVEIVQEFAILGHCISRIWAQAPPPEQPGFADIASLYQELHQASAAAVEMFHRHMLEDEQTEKRYLRQLQQVADEALHGDKQTFVRRLVEVLVLILEAIDAQTAVLLLHDTQSLKLVDVISTGAAHEDLKRHVISRATTDWSVQTTGAEQDSFSDSRELRVPAALKRQGIRSLLAVRLPPRHGWLAFIYVGMTKAQSFAARQVRRVETLGAWLLLHLDNAQLYTSLKEKNQALQVQHSLREQFVSIMAHDLRGPLAAAKVFAQLLIRQPEHSGERRDLAIKIERGIERADHMIRDLLDANRIRAGERLPLRLDDCDLGSVADEVVAEFCALHGDRVVLNAEQGVRGIWSAEELRRALWNLVTNALKYGAPDQQITVAVRRTQRGAEASVHNHGSVISKDEQGRLFEPFVRAKAPSVGTVTGWGLGLTLVRGCAEAHGGRVEVASDTTTGTTFTLVLPLDSRPYQLRSEWPEPAK